MHMGKQNPWLKKKKEPKQTIIFVLDMYRTEKHLMTKWLGSHIHHWPTSCERAPTSLGTLISHIHKPLLNQQDGLCNKNPLSSLLATLQTNLSCFNTWSLNWNYPTVWQIVVFASSKKGAEGTIQGARTVSGIIYLIQKENSTYFTRLQVE